MNSRQKGRIGHTYTEQYLKERGWSTYTCPHATLQWEGGSSGWKDAFAAPSDENGKLIGGFDIIALKKYSNFNSNPDSCSFGVCDSGIKATLWQVKKTKRNSITPLLKREIQHCADYHKLPRSSCYVIHWPDGVGPKKGKPNIWRADQD
jgi:hypothetical protein